MTFIDTIKSLFASSDGSARRNGRLYVVDAARLVDEKTGRRMAPREQINLLNALSKVAKQEGLNIQAVFESDRPLREVENGGEYNGITVYFMPDSESLMAHILKLCRKTNGVLVSSGANLESRATEQGITVLSSSTFRKAFLQGGGSSDRTGGGSHGGRNNDRRRNNDRKRSRNGNGRHNNKPQSNGGQDNQSSSASSESADPVRNLIDLVE